MITIEDRKMPSKRLRAGKLGYDLLMGDIVYPSCFHTFSYVLGHALERTGARGAQTHQCPRCTQPRGTCLLCLHPWRDTATACPCGLFFDGQEREARRRAFVGRGWSVGHDARRFVAMRRAMGQRRAARLKRLLAAAAEEKAAAGKTEDVKAGDDGAVGERAADERPADGKTAEEQLVNDK